MRLALVLVVACASPRQVVAPAPVGIGVIVGEIDEAPGAGEPGATIVVKGDLGHEEVAISDENGRYRFEVRPDRYRVTVFFEDETIELGVREVRADATVNADVVVGPLGRCAYEHKRNVAGTAAERDAVASAALERFLRDRSLPGSERLPNRAILVDIDHLSPGALPVAGAMFVPATAKTLEALARDREPVAYLRFGGFRFYGGCALVEIGVAVMPRPTCCATEKEIFEVTETGAVFWPDLNRPHVVLL
jgi:hypothetical protein